MEASEDLRHADRVTEILRHLLGAHRARVRQARHRSGPRVRRAPARRKVGRVRPEIDDRDLPHGEPVGLVVNMATDEHARLHRDADRSYLICNYFLLPSEWRCWPTTSDRIEHYEVAATLSGFATTSFATNYLPEAEIAITDLRQLSRTGLRPRGARLGCHDEHSHGEVCPRLDRPVRAVVAQVESRRVRSEPTVGGGGYFLLHRYRGFDSAGGGRPGCHVGRAGHAQQGVALGRRRGQ